VRFLLVNPWIADFAAYNFWVRPLGLYALAEWLYSLGADIHLLDCLSPFPAPGRFKRVPVPLPIQERIPIKRSFARYGIDLSEFRHRLGCAMPFDAVFITSVMSYWYPGVSWVVEEIRRAMGNVPIILGGIYATLWKEHAMEHMDVDVVCSGPLRENTKKIADFLGLGDRIRQWRPWYRLPLWDGADYGAVRTAVGCPFRCTYCASRIVSGSFRQRNIEQVLEEMVFLYNKGARQIAFYDDALLVDFDSRLGPLLERLESKRIRLEFHTPNGLHARFFNRDVALRLVRSDFKTVRLSLETVNPKRQKDTGGKVTSQDLERAIDCLLAAGMSRDCIGVYLLVGLPDQDLEEIEESILYVQSLGVRPYLAEFSPIPGTLDWQRLERKNIVSKNMDPLLTNNTIFYRLYKDYDTERFRRLKRLAASSA